jgi:hypothetical protein
MRRFLPAVALLASAVPAFAQSPTPAVAPTTAHAWYVRPDIGGWMVCVKSYTGPHAKAAAEELAKEIRETHKAPAYLFERGSEEKRKQDEYIAKERAKQIAAQQEFLKTADKLRDEAALKGMEFLETPTRVRIPKLKTVEEQWAVLIGGWPDDVTARQALTTIRTWPSPKNPNLMDSGMVMRKGADGKSQGETTYFNPYAAAHVVPNPVAAKVETAESAETLKALFRLNEKETLSTLHVAKPYTLVVKSFHPARKGLMDKDGEKSVVQKLFGGGGPDGREMQACANQAAELCKALRNPSFKPRPYDAAVLHTFYGSIVTVGGFDSLEDPALLDTARQLDALTFTMTQADTQKTEHNVKMFDNIFPMPVPKKP